MPPVLHATERHQGFNLQGESAKQVGVSSPPTTSSHDLPLSPKRFLQYQTENVSKSEQRVYSSSATERMFGMSTSPGPIPAICS